MAGSSTDLQVANEHTVRFSSLLKAWQKRKDRKSNTEFWDYLKPELQYAEVEPGQTPPLGAVPVGVMLVGVGCNKRLSAKNASDTGKNHKNCVKCKQAVEELRAAAAAARTGSSAGSSAGAGSKRQRDAAAALDQLLPSVGGDEDVQVLAEMGAMERPSKQQKITDYAWNMSLQQQFHREWTEACIVDGDSFSAVSSTSAKAVVIQRYFGASLPDRKKMAGPCLDAAADSAAKQRSKALGQVNGFAVGYDGGKDRHMGGGSKMISVAALLPSGSTQYLDTINTEDCRLDAATYAGFLKSTLAQHGGLEKVTGLVSDREAVCVRTSEDLQKEAPHLVLVYCQGHALHHLVADLRALPAVDQMFDACHQIIGMVVSEKALKRAYQAKCAGLGTSGYLRLAPSHRFAYQVFEADDVLANFSALSSVCEDSSLLRQLQDRPAYEEVVALVLGDELLGEGNNMFPLKQLLEITLPPFKKVQQAIATIEANSAQLSIVEAMWRTLTAALAELGSGLQASRRGRGATAAEQRKERIMELVKARHQQYRSPSNILAALLDPVNSVAPTDGGNRKPPTSWFTPDELQSACKEAERLGTAIGNLPATQLPTDISPGGYGLSARYAMDALVSNGFPDDTISHCAVLQRGEDGAVTSIKWSAISRRRNAVKTMLGDQGEVALAAVADRVLSQHATVCAVDRVWSELGNMFPANRSRLAVAKGNKMMLVRNSYRMQHGITNSDKEMETAFWIEDLAGVDS